jgi:dihydrofolate reductase
MQPVIATMSISLDNIGAGPNQTLERPFGDIPPGILHRWMFETPDENRAETEAIVAAGAFIMGRNMFGPIRGEWTGDWRGWWDENPPYHHDVFVLTHHPRESVVMEGGTTFHFVTEGIEVAMERAQAVTGDLPVHVSGGVSTINAYLAAGLVDELMLQIAPVVLGEGLRLFEGVGPLTLEQLEVRPVSLATHVRYRVVR